MRTLFADSFFYFAFLNPRDRAHRSALTVARDNNLQIVTTEYVIFELMDGLSNPFQRQRISRFVRLLHSAPSTRVLPASPRYFREAHDLYEARPDKAWSLTDCTSFVVMQDMGIAEALTGDVYFEQAGFKALLRAAD